MLDMVLNSITLFFRGKLFQDPVKVVQLAVLGTVLTMIICIGLAMFGLPFWLAAVVAGLVGGGFQPWLFRNLKYR